MPIRSDLYRMLDNNLFVQIQPPPGTPPPGQPSKSGGCEGGSSGNPAALLNAQQLANMASVNEVQPVLVERKGPKEGQLVGPRPFMQAVHFTGPDRLIGSITDIQIEQGYANSLSGTAVTGTWSGTAGPPPLTSDHEGRLATSPARPTTSFIWNSPTMIWSRHARRAYNLGQARSFQVSLSCFANKVTIGGERGGGDPANQRDLALPSP